MRVFAGAIEDIVAAHPGLYLKHCVVMAVAILSRLSPSPCEFTVECQGFAPPGLGGDTRFLLQVSWNHQSSMRAARIWDTEHTTPIVERAAVGPAAMLFAQMIPNGSMRVTCQGDRADYWLPQLREALEISGTEQRREFARRYKAKVAQMLKNPRKWDGYVLVCCFGAKSRLIRWSHHTQEEP